MSLGPASGALGRASEKCFFIIFCVFFDLGRKISNMNVFERRIIRKVEGLQIWILRTGRVASLVGAVGPGWPVGSGG